MTEVKEISAIDTYLVRNAVLRKGKPIETCLFPGDDLPTTKHFGVFSGQLVGVISLFEKNNPIFDAPFQVQVRGMAILEDFQGMRLGEKLIESCESYLAGLAKDTLIWFNARESAVGFYDKLGYQTMGGIFDIEGVGKHYVMFKNLSV
jgi:ribosomal protein S18 acetylase RimI-like enzyme